MCRIAGIIDPSTDVATLKNIVQLMNDCLSHGGPDDEGMYANDEDHVVLGNRRLSLLDLSPAGHMPMTCEDGRFTLTYNGEIYNYQELKQELEKAGHEFKTGTDTEVILVAYKQWGRYAFAKFNGMFGLALYDHAEKKLILARGPSGIKPLYFSTYNNKLAFASEVRALKLVPELQEEHPEWKIYMMAYGHIPEPLTTLKHVRSLPKGSAMFYDLRTHKSEMKSYHHFAFHEGTESRAQSISIIKDSLRASVKRHLLADAPIGVFLSGGIDSSIIALLAHEQKKDIDTLSLIFEDKRYSEKPFQDIIRAKMQLARHHQFLLKEKDFHQHLPHILEAMDMPSSDGINTWFISKYARETGLKAVLSGIGGDELFGGYPSFSRLPVAIQLAKLPDLILKAAGKFSNKRLHRLPYLTLDGAKGLYLFLRGQSIPSEICKYLDCSEKQVWETLDREPEMDNIDHLTAKNKASFLELNFYMGNQLLRDSDVMSMIHGLEIRVPFLDKEFLKNVVKTNSDIKYSGTYKKQLLIDAFSDILPDQIYKRPKMGFTFPFAEWLSKDKYVEDQFLSGTANGKNLYKEFKAGKLHWSQLLTVMLIENKINA